MESIAIERMARIFRNDILICLTFEDVGSTKIRRGFCSIEKIPYLRTRPITFVKITTNVIFVNSQNIKLLKYKGYWKYFPSAV